MAYTKHDNALDSKEKSQLIKDAIEKGLSEDEAIQLINKWIRENGVKEVEGYPLPDDSAPWDPIFDLFKNGKYYEILGLSRNAAREEIQKAYDEKYQKIKRKYFVLQF